MQFPFSLINQKQHDEPYRRYKECNSRGRIKGQGNNNEGKERQYQVVQEWE